MTGTRSALKRAKELANQTNATPIDLAEALWKLEQADPGGVRKLVEAAETELKPRRAYYLLSVWDRFATLDIPRDLLVRAGWTKLALIARYSEPGVEQGLLELAQPGRSTAKELEDQLKGHVGGRPKRRSILLRLSPSQHKTFVRVLVKYGAKVSKNQRGLARKEAALIKALVALDG